MCKLRNSVHRFIDVNGPLITLLPQGFYPKFQRMDPSSWTRFVVGAGLGPFGSEPEYLLTPLSTQGPINLFGRISAKNSCCQKFLRADTRVVFECFKISSLVGWCGGFLNFGALF